MDIKSATNAVSVEETDGFFRFEFTEIVPLTRDTDGSCTTERVSGDRSAEVKWENLAVVKEEPDVTLHTVSQNKPNSCNFVAQHHKNCFNSHIFLYTYCIGLVSY